MPKAMHEVHVGEVYGLLTVREVGLRAERTPGQVAHRQTGERAAMCSCACGSDYLAKVGELSRGVRTSCGCTRQPKRPPAPTIVLGTDELLARADVSTPVHHEAAPVQHDGAAVHHVVPAIRPEAAPVQHEPARRRPGRQPRTIDTTAFTDVIEGASRAYLADSGYLIKMMQSAQIIQRKRNTWNLRLELRAAHEKAREACAASTEVSECLRIEPCSTATCPFGPGGDVAELVGIPALPKTSSSGRMTRPKPRPEHVPGMIYSVEAAVQPLIDLRTERGTLDTTYVSPEERREAERQRACAARQEATTA